MVGVRVPGCQLCGKKDMEGGEGIALDLKKIWERAITKNLGQELRGGVKKKRKNQKGWDREEGTGAKDGVIQFVLETRGGTGKRGAE